MDGTENKIPGFPDGFNFPIANAENKALEVEVQNLQKQKEEFSSHLDDSIDRLSALRIYLTNLERERDENQRLLFFHDAQVHSEETRVKICRAEINSLTTEQNNYVKNIADLQEKQNDHKVEFKKCAVKVEKIKVLLRWDEETLEAWAQEVARGTEDTSLLDQFNKQDQARLGDLELKRCSLREEVETKRHQLEKIKDDVLSLELSLEKTGTIFQKQQEERRGLLCRWEGSVRIIHQRDVDINHAMKEVGSLRVVAKQRVAELEEHKTFCENEMRNNYELEKEVDATTREADATKETVETLANALTDVQGQVMVLQGCLSRNASAVSSHRQECRRIGELIMTKRKLSSALEIKLELLRQEIRSIQSNSASAADRLNQLALMKEEEERIGEKIFRENQKLQEKMRKVTEELLRLRTRESEQRAEMTGVEACIHTVRKQTQSALEEHKRQADMLYAAELNYLKKSLDYRRMLGKEKDENKEEMEMKVLSLKELLKEIKDNENLLIKERYHLDQEYRRLVTALGVEEKELASLESKKQDKFLAADCAEKRLRSLRCQNQDRQVDENVIKLRVKQMEKAVQKIGGKLYTLERQRLELEEAVKERGMEVDALMDILRVRRRVLLDQVSALNSKINVAKLKVDHLRNKYEVCISSMGTNEAGETETVLYYKIKAAQERYQLQEMGDSLDEKIKKTEQEIRAMENTLTIVHKANSTYKRSLAPVEADGPELQEKEALETQYLNTVRAIAQKKGTLLTLQGTAASLEENIRSQLDLEVEITTRWKERDTKAAELDKELLEQEEKLARAARILRKMAKDVRGTQATQFRTHEERDIELRELLEQNQACLQRLSELVARTVDTSPVVIRYLQENGFSLPDAQSSRMGSTSRLSTSSRSSSHSLIASNSSIKQVSSASMHEAKVKPILRNRKSSTDSQREVKDTTIDIADIFPQATK